MSASVVVAGFDRIGVLASQPAVGRAPWRLVEVPRAAMRAPRAARRAPITTTTGGIADASPGAGRRSSADDSNNPKETMNPQLVYVTTQRRCAEQGQSR
jgi:hypothetical protein